MSTIAGYTTETKLFENGITALFSARHPLTSRRVLLKVLKGEHPQVERLNQFRNEYELLSTFDSPYIARTYGLERHQNSLVIVLEDWLDDYSPLTELIDEAPFSLKLLLRIGEEISKALAIIHDSHITHCSVSPSSILVRKDKRHIKLIDFSRATGDGSTNQIRTSLPLPDRLLPYISPEQTGRLEQEVDSRSDLYSLGVTLFQMATGILPFFATGAGELVHAHLAQIPPSPDTINQILPSPISAIILKLLEKIPERRYQSSRILLHDLQHCRTLLQEGESINDFQLAQHDLFRSLDLPQQLLCRSSELQMLKNKLRSADKARLEAVFLAGCKGVGKSSLLQEFTSSLSRDTTYILAAGFSNDAPPLSPFTAVVRQLIRRILSESSSSINTRKVHLLRTLGVEAAALTAAFPETAQLIGPHHPPESLAPVQHQHRMFRVLGKFFKTCCETGPVLTFFLDDIHFADDTELRLLHHIVSSAGISRMLFIGSHLTQAAKQGALKQFLHDLEATLPQVEKVTLASLQLPDIVNLLAASLDRLPGEVSELATLCLNKTGGNPYFLREFLLEANHRNHLFFSPTKQCWQWHLNEIERSELTRNRAEAVKKSIPSLPAGATELLVTAACLGTSCSLELVTAILGHNPEKELRTVFREGMMFTSHDQGLGTRLHFAHIQIRKEALMQLRFDERAAIRLRAGRHLLHTLSHEEYRDQLQEIARYLRCSHVRRVASHSERLEIARVHLAAGNQSLDNGQVRQAHSSFSTGQKALPEGSWDNNYRLTLRLHVACCESALLVRDYQRTSHLFRTVCDRAHSLIDCSRVYILQIRALKAQGFPARAVTVALTILEKMGVNLPENPSRLDTLRPLISTWLRLRFSPKEAILNGSLEMRHPQKLATMSILQEISPAVYSAAPHLIPFLAAHAIRLSLRYGYAADTVVTGYALFALSLCGLSPLPPTFGYRYGQFALTLAKARNDNKNIHHLVFATFISHWQNDLHESLPPLRQSLNINQQSPPPEVAAYTACSICYRHYLCCTNLSTITGVCNEYIEMLNLLGQEIPTRRLSLIAEAVNNMQGKTLDPVELKGEIFHETTQLPLCIKGGDYTTYNLAMIIKMIHAVLFEDYQRAISYSEEVYPHLASLTASSFIPLYYCYDSLARLATTDAQSRSQRLRTRLRVAAQQRKLHRLAKINPANFGHIFYLVEAERRRLQGQRELAMELYDTAIHMAHENQYTREEALAYELAARYYTQAKKPHIARLYLREARYCYYRWGATAKVSRLDMLGVADPLQTLTATGLPAHVSFGEGASRVDMLTVIKASRVLSSEMVLDELLKKMMRIMLESGGAQKGALVFREEGDWRIRVWGTADRPESITLARTPVNAQEIVSTTILNYVTNSGRDVVLDNACHSREFLGDPYIGKHQQLSVLCMPIVYQGDVFCILYLENNLATGTFPPDRQEMLQLLGVHASISLKNAFLFNELEHTVGRLNQEIEKRQSTQQQLLHAEKLSALGRLSASIAHEFGNPLMGVKYLLEDFAKRDNSTPADRQLIELGLEECERMKILIRDLQRLNKPSSGKKQRTDIHQLVEHVLLFQKKHFSSNRISVVTEFDRSLPQVEVIVDQVTQVLFNLTMNAVDAMTGKDGQLTVTTRREAATMFIDVQDTGDGIAKIYWERIFEPFFSTKKEEDGTGLGLSISYGIARHHGGDLTFSTVPGTGTTFTLSLPLSSDSSATLVSEGMYN